MCANCLFLSLSLFLCLYTGLNEASPTPCEMSTGCPCDDIQEIVYKEGRKMESQQEDLLDNLLDNFRGAMSSLLEDMSGTLQTQIGAIAHNISKFGSNVPMELLHKKVVETTKLQMDNLNGELKSQQILLNATLNEMKSQFQKHLKSQEQELQEIRYTQAKSLEVLERIQSYCNNSSMSDQDQDIQPFVPTEASTSQEITAKTVSAYPLDEVLPIASTALIKGSYQHPVNSCKDLPSEYPSGEYYTLNTCNKTPVKVYCDMTRVACNSTGGWMRAMMLDMTNSSHNCPDNFKLIDRSSSKPHRLCGRKSSGCTSATVKTFGVSYSMVCGRIRAYQYGAPYAFYKQSAGIESYYIDGISLTYGGPGPRKHIWTFAAGSDETSAASWVCPCTRTDLSWGGTIPSFVGTNYFCDTANHDRSYTYSTEFYDDPLWDGDGCVSTSTCCCFNTPPWFCTELPEVTTTNIELRLCSSQVPGNTDVPIELAEIYVK